MKLVAFDPALSIRRATDRFLRQHAVQVETVLEFDNIENIKRAVELPGGAAILPEPTLAPNATPARSRRFPSTTSC